MDYLPHWTIDTLVCISGDTHQAIAIADGSSHLVLGSNQRFSFRIERPKIYHYFLASLWHFQFDGIEAIVLWHQGCVWSQITILHLLHLGIEGTSIRTCLLASIVEVGIHKMTIAIEHLVIKLLLSHLILTFIGNHRVLAYFTFTIKLSNTFESMLLSPPFDDVW